jgi:hypothetical protein
MRPAIVIVLKILQPDQVIRNNLFIASRQAIVVRRFPKRVDDIVEKSVVEAALIQIHLHLVEFFLGFVQAHALPVFSIGSAPYMFQIGPHIIEDVGPPVLPLVALVAVLIPVLGKGSHRHRRNDETGS